MYTSRYNYHKRKRLIQYWFSFPVDCDPRCTLAEGLGANPDGRQNYRVHKSGLPIPAISISGFLIGDYFVNSTDSTDGFIVNGTFGTYVTQEKPWQQRN